MKNVVIIVASATVGYFIGFYEMKYKMLKTVVNVLNEDRIKENESEKND